MRKEILIPVVEHRTNAQQRIEDLDTDRIAATFERMTVPGDKSIDLKLVMTQACNLSCQYCPQQKNEPTVKWTDESLSALFEGFLKAYPGEGKVWRWFGGEPMLFGKLIYRFMTKYKNEIENTPNFTLEMTTNGTLLTDEFVEMFTGMKNTILIISLDSLFSEDDWRQLKSDQLKRVVNALQLVAKHHGIYNTRIIMNSVPDHIPLLMLNLQLMYRLGVRDFYLNNILFDHKINDYIQWDEKTLKPFEDTIRAFCEQHKDAYVLFAPETKPKDKRELNCLVGRKGMSIDGSGDVTGCAMFSTDKKRYDGNITVFANVFKGIVVDDFEERYNVPDNLYSTDPRCKECNIEGLCSMCPISHATATLGEAYFASTPYCQNIVRSHIVTRDIGAKNLEFRQNLIKEYEEKHAADKKFTGGTDGTDVKRG